MKYLLIFPFLLFLVSCGTPQPTSSPEFPITMTHKIAGNRLTVNATVTNNSAETISLVKNPNFYGISVRAQDPKLDEAVNPKIVTYGPATSKEVAVLAPGHSTTFSTNFYLRRLIGGPVEVEREVQAHGPRSFMVISDDTFKTTFSYEHYSRFLTPTAQKAGQNFCNSQLRAKSTFRRPFIPLAAPQTPAPSQKEPKKQKKASNEII